MEAETDFVAHVFLGECLRCRIVLERLVEFELLDGGKAI